jgi:hypothetical protein
MTQSSLLGKLKDKGAQLITSLGGYIFGSERQQQSLRSRIQAAPEEEASIDFQNEGKCLTH